MKPLQPWKVYLIALSGGGLAVCGMLMARAAPLYAVYFGVLVGIWLAQIHRIITRY